MNTTQMEGDNQAPLSFWTKVFYGMGNMGISATGIILAYCLMFFLTDVAGLSPFLASCVWFCGLIGDAISDPIIGMLSDRTRTPWGRRYPWIFLGAIPFGLSFLLLWQIPFKGNPGLLFLYYAIVGIIFKTCYTAVYLPYVALTTELSQGYNERTNLNSFRFSFALGSGLLALGAIKLIFTNIDSLYNQYLAIGAIGAVLCIFPLYCCVLGTINHVLPRERQHIQSSQPKSFSVKQQLQIVMENRPFLLVMGLYCCSWIAVQITTTVIQYFVVIWMQSTTEVLTHFALIVQGTALTMLFVWSWISRFVGKRTVYFLGCSIWITAHIGLFTLQPGQIGWLYFFGAIAGIGVSTAYLVPWSMLPDVIELDELKTGQRREGVFYAFMVMMQKVGLAISVVAVGLALDLAGYMERVAGTPAQVQPASALLVIRLAIGPIPVILLLGGIYLAYLYPISKDVHRQIMATLKKRRQHKQTRQTIQPPKPARLPSSLPQDLPSAMK